MTDKFKPGGPGGSPDEFLAARVDKKPTMVFDVEDPLTEDAPREYVIQALAGREEGWWPIGELSLTGGPSGAGKTHLLLHIVEAVRRGVESFGHQTGKRDYCILLHDRSLAAMRSTVRAAKLPVAEVMSRVIRLSKAQMKELPAVVLEAAILSRPGVTLWILEGLDFWTPELHKLDAVGDVLDDIQRVATQYKVAVVATLGSPKQKENDRYASGRDQFMGSVAFGRKSETCISLEKSADDKRVRKVNVMPRNTADEEFWFTWTDAGLTLTTEPEKPNTEGAEEGKALGLMRLNVFSRCKPGEEIKYDPAMGSWATFSRWRQIARASGTVVLTKGKWYRSPASTGKAARKARPGVFDETRLYALWGRGDLSLEEQIELQRLYIADPMGGLGMKHRAQARLKRLLAEQWGSCETVN
jgi:hypothetical protein